MTFRPILTIAATALLFPGLAFAQAAAPPPAAAPTVPPFVIQSDGGDNRLQFAFLGQMDGRFFLADSQHRATDTFAARRLRPILQGRVARNFEFLFTPDLAGGGVNIRDAYFDTRFSNAFRLRMGKAKVPFSIERIHGAATLLFVERSMTTIVAPDRDFGVQVLGDLLQNRLNYQAAIVNGGGDGAAIDADTNDAKDLAGRVVVRPWLANAMSPLNGLGFALAGSDGRQPMALPSFRTSGLNLFFAYAPGVVGDGPRRRVSPQAFYYHGRFGGFFEYVRSNGRVQRGAVSSEVDHVAWQVTGSWVITGEAATDRGVRPKNNFDPENHRWGAVQLAARYHHLGVGADAVTRGLAAPGTSRIADAFTAGANWYLNPFVKWVFNFERTVFDGHVNGPRAPENAVLLRGQLSF
jgi:phosphate-selective porin OprO and OprP